MVDCIDRIFKVPQLVVERAEKRIARLKGGLKDVSSGMFYHKQTSQMDSRVDQWLHLFHDVRCYN